MEDPARDLEAYATLAAELSDPRVNRGAVLAARGLDEDRWEAIDDAWQARLEAADDDDEGVPALVLAHAEAFAHAQRARGGDVLPFDRFVEATRQIARGDDLAGVMKRLDLTLDAYLRAEAHWTAAMIEDDALARRFRDGIR